VFVALDGLGPAGLSRRAFLSPCRASLARVDCLEEEGCQKSLEEAPHDIQLVDVEVSKRSDVNKSKASSSTAAPYGMRTGRD